MPTNTGTGAVQAPVLPAATGGLFVLSTPQPADGAAMARFMSLAGSTHRDASPALARWLDEHVGPRAAGDPPPPATAWELATPNAAEIVDGLPAEGERWAACDPRAIVAWRRLAAALPGARFVVFVESPQAGLASWIEDYRSAPALVERRLDAWRRAARALLDGLPSLRDRLWLVAVEDAADAATAAKMGARHLGLAGDTAPANPASESTAVPRDPLADAFARGWVLDDEAALLYARLLAACETPDAAATPSTRVDAGRARLVGLLRDACEARRELARDPGLLDAVGRSLGRPDPDTTKSVGASPLVQAVRHLQQARDGLAQMSALLRDNDLLNTFLQQMQEELEFRRQAPAPAPAAPCPAVLGTEQFDPPHRHLDFTARCPLEAGGTVEVAGRLVEHHGRAGLLVFSDGGQVFSRWTESGDEGGRGFMLVVPEDGACASWIDGASASDWALLTRLTQSLRAALTRDLPMVQSEFWHGVAGRLVSQLASWPPRVRWDRSTVAVAEGDGERSLQLDVSGLSFGDHPPRPVQLRLRQPAAGPARVELLLAPAGERPWLASWPSPGGTAQPVWVLPAGRQWAIKDKRAAWRKVSPDDRRLLRSLLESLPQIYAQASGADRAPIALSAAESHTLGRLAADARRAMSPPLLREWARRWAAAWRSR